MENLRTTTGTGLMEDMQKGLWTGLIKELWTHLWDKTLIQSETGLRWVKGVNVQMSALLNEKVVTDKCVLFSWWLFWNP